MITRNIFTKLSVAMALVALLATAAIWEARQVRATPTAVESQPSFGILGITRGQTLRLNVVNLTPSDPNGRQIPPPCRVLLTFRDGNGHPFHDPLSDSILERIVRLQPGESAFLDLNGDTFAGPSTNADTTGPARLQLRPFVRVLAAPPDPDRNFPPGPCRPTAEVFDNTTGRTSIFAAFEPPPDPDRGGGQ